ncbi:protein obstructor-E-like [Planococcus citri]|uniref:protein obstructor-E-like n=1 Tax=Planococcus citri TaxID=170843 RepID=UPI0031FA447A
MYSVVLAVFLLAFSQAQSQHFLQSNSCPETYGEQTYHHPELCDHFVLCVNGSLSVEQCENGLLYDGKGNVHQHCNYYWDVDCGTRKADHIAPISSPGCEFKYGIYSEGPSCSSNYVKCADGYPHVQDCEPGLVYDDRIKKCNWPDLMLETCNPEAVIGFKCPDKVDPQSAQARFWPYPRFAIPGDCERLITCVNGYPRLITCGDGKVFDDETLTCAEPEEVAKCAHHRKRK